MRFRRHIPRRRDWTAWLQRPVRRPEETRRRVVITLAIALVTFTAGYLVSALVIFPAPIFARTITVPQVLGLQGDAARQRLEDAGFRPGETDPISHPSAATGAVVWQDPPAGVAMRLGSTVTISWSRGPQRIPVPDVTGYESRLARLLIGAAGLRVARTDSTPSSIPRGVVVNTRPPAGSTRLPGASVTLVVSVGPATLTIPDLTGLTVEEANGVLMPLGLVLGEVNTLTSNAGPPGTIFEQDPSPGTLSAAGAAVDVTVVRGFNE